MKDNGEKISPDQKLSPSYSLKRSSNNLKPVNITKRNSLINFHEKKDTNTNKSSDADTKMSPLKNHKTVTNLEKLFSKIRKNLILIFTFLLIIFIYYIYLFLYILPLIQSSNKGLDYRFWYSLHDGIYRKGFSYFLIFHILLILIFYSMLVSMFTDPGSIDAEYLKYFDLVENIDEKPINDINMKNKLKIMRREKNIVQDPGCTIEKNPDEKENNNCNGNNNNTTPITMDSFEKLFSTELSMNDYQYDSYNPNLDTNYLHTKEFFFKFLYYTRDLNYSDIRKNKHYCVFCKIIRPERSHHCRECKKCILKMDHHCGILNSCVGHHNYRPWMVFVFYSTFTLLFLLLTMIDGISFYLDKNFYGIQTFNCKLFLFTFVLVLIGFVSVAELFITHLLFISKGVTTIEDKSSNMMDQLITRDAGKGFFESMKEIFGKNACTWFFPINRKFRIYEGYIWRNNGETYYEYINQRRMEYFTKLGDNHDNDTDLSREAENFSVEGDNLNFSDISHNDSIRNPI